MRRTESTLGCSGAVLYLLFLIVVLTLVYSLVKSETLQIILFPTVVTIWILAGPVIVRK